jgi:hypothetical protein
MAWVKLDDRVFKHRKIRPLSCAAQLVFIRAIALSAMAESDGVIHKRDISELIEGFTGRAGKAAFAELVAAELLHETVSVEEWTIHDFLHYQPGSARSAEMREANRKRQDRFRTRNTTQPDNALRNALAEPVSNALPQRDPVPSRPISSSRASEVTTPAADDPALKPQDEKPLTKSQAADISHPANRARLHEWHANTCPNINLERELDKFALHCQARNLRFADPVAAAQEWLLKARPAKATGTNPADPERPPPRPKPWAGDDLPDIVPDHARHAIANVKANLRREPQETRQ